MTDEVSRVPRTVKSRTVVDEGRCPQGQWAAVKLVYFLYKLLMHFWAWNVLTFKT